MGSGLYWNVIRTSCTLLQTKSWRMHNIINRPLSHFLNPKNAFTVARLTRIQSSGVILVFNRSLLPRFLFFPKNPKALANRLEKKPHYNEGIQTQTQLLKSFKKFLRTKLLLRSKQLHLKFKNAPLIG